MARGYSGYGACRQMDSTVSSEERWSSWLAASLASLDEASLRRTRQPLEPLDAVHVLVEGVPLTLFSGNDYLGLSGHPEVRKAAAEAALAHGLGPRGSALVCGYTDEHCRLEEELATLKGVDASVLMPTGYAANLCVLQALAGEGVAIFSDALNHASIVDGCRLASRSGALVHVYRHGDVCHLEELLATCSSPRRIIVTDTVFSMDGDLAPLEALVAVKRRYGALLVVDDAHGTLVYGTTGSGVVEHLGVSEGVDLHVGTLSKAFGALGGFVAGSRDWCDWLVNRGRAQIYSTALPLPIVAAARASLRIAVSDSSHRDRLWSHVARVSAAINRQCSSPIIALVVGSPEKALLASRVFLEAGLHATAIRPPTVLEGTSRLRLTLSAVQSSSDIDRLIEAVGYLQDRNLLSRP
jgi:8-amino-7-oxononanoate synthase